MSGVEPLRDFIREMTMLVDRAGLDETAIFDAGMPLLAHLVSKDDWLPEAFA